MSSVYKQPLAIETHLQSAQLYLSHASCAHAYGRAISSSGFSEWATLRERASRDNAMSTSSGGNGPFRVGTSPVRACSMLALLMLTGQQSLDQVNCNCYEVEVRRYVEDAAKAHVYATVVIGMWGGPHRQHQSASLPIILCPSRSLVKYASIWSCTYFLTLTAKLSLSEAVRICPYQRHV